MTTFISIASGESLNNVDLSLVRKSGFPVIACNNSWQKYPDANFLCAYDKSWWLAYKPDFKGLGVCRSRVFNNIWFNPDYVPAGCNSGLYALYWARACQAKRVILLGYDMHGRHWHPDHPGGMKNPAKGDFDKYINQFAEFSGCDIINATEGSALDCFKKTSLMEALCKA